MVLCYNIENWGDYLSKTQISIDTFHEEKLCRSFRVKAIIFGVIAHASLLAALYIESFFIIFTLCFLFLLLCTTVSYKRKISILETQRLIFSCENDNNLYDLFRHYCEALKKAKKGKGLLTARKYKEVFKKYKFILLNEKQNYIGTAMTKHYKSIEYAIKNKSMYQLREIYNSCNALINSINTYKNQFDEKNTKFSASLLEKSYVIIDFVARRINCYNIGNTYNIDLMKGQDFEKFCANLLKLYGFDNVEVTKGSGDQGVDIIGIYKGYRFAVQCKRYSKKLGNSPIQEVVAGKKFYNCQGALVITNNYFTDSAVQLAKANNVQLWDRKNLMEAINYTDSQWDELLEKISLG